MKDRQRAHRAGPLDDAAYERQVDALQAEFARKLDAHQAVLDRLGDEKKGVKNGC
jgi:hypothetical protein